LDARRFGGHLHGLCEVAQFERHRTQRHSFGRGEGDVILPVFLESGETDGQVIGAGQQVGDDAGSGVVG